jgi:colanic acid biosynthesis glycosyl transferase WcaI
MSRRVIFLTQWFDPEPIFKGMLFARELTKKGYEVEVITGFPNYILDTNSNSFKKK